MNRFVQIVPFRDKLIGLDQEGNIYIIDVLFNGQFLFTLHTSNPLQ